MSTIEHEIITQIQFVLQLLYIIKCGIRSQAHHLDNFEHIEQKPIVEVSNKNELTLAKSLICAFKLYEP